MALKADRIHIDSDISHFMNNTAERGGIVSAVTLGSGAAMDQSAAVVNYVGNPSGVRPLGVLMNDVVNLDLTRQHPNWHKDEVQVQGKVTIWPKCTVVTNYIEPGQTIAVGEPAYVGHSGRLSNVDVATDDGPALNATLRLVGRWISTQDEDGYAKVSVNLP